MTASWPDGCSAHEHTWQHGKRRVPQGTPQSSSNRPGGHPLHWHIEVSSQWVCCPLGVGGQTRGPLFWFTQGCSFSPLGCQARDQCGRHPHLYLLGRGRATDVRGSGQVMVPCRMLYRPLAFDLVTMNSSCWRPLVPRCSASSYRHSTFQHRKLAWCSWHSPWKKKKMEENQVPWMWQWQGQREIESQTEQKRICGWVVSGIHHLLMLVNPPLPSRLGPSQI